MKDVLVVGGMGSGKTTLCKTLVNEVPGMAYHYSSQYNVRIPLHLYKQQMLSGLDRQQLIQRIVTHPPVDTDVPREELDRFGNAMLHVYGATIFAELSLAALKQGAPNCIDSMCKASNVRHLKEHGIYVVGLDCKPEVQVQRRLADHKGIDPTQRAELEMQVMSTNAFFELDQILELADVRYRTDWHGANAKSMAHDIMKRAN